MDQPKHSDQNDKDNDTHPNNEFIFKDVRKESSNLVTIRKFAQVLFCIFKINLPPSNL